MSQVTAVAGRGIPLQGDDIDTDRIIPARFLKCVTFDGLGEHVFEDDRAPLNGAHPFDQPQYQGATVLVVNRNFGCGSSREHAPQAIARWGIQAIIGESFAEIFFGNCVAMGIPCLTAEKAIVTELQTALAANPQLPMAIDVPNRVVRWGDRTAPLNLPDGAHQMFVSGTWDACGQLVAQADAIRATAQTLPYLGWSSLTAS